MWFYQIINNVDVLVSVSIYGLYSLLSKSLLSYMEQQQKKHTLTFTMKRCNIIIQ